MDDSAAARRVAMLTGHLQPGQVTSRQRWPLTPPSTVLTLALSTQAGRNSTAGALRHCGRCTWPEGVRRGCVPALAALGTGLLTAPVLTAPARQVPRAASASLSRCC